MLFNAANGLAVNALLRDFGWFFGRFNNAAWVEPRAVFASAEAFVRGTPAPYFLWVHLYPPHGPYLTYQRFLGRFLPGSDLTTQAQYFWQTPGADYPPAMQHEVDLLRLRYDESIANCDNALGEFLDWMTRDGRDANTILIGTSDHGENFSGGRWTHESPNLHYAETHIPLLISLPHQNRGYTETERRGPHRRRADDSCRARNSEAVADGWPFAHGPGASGICTRTRLLDVPRRIQPFRPSDRRGNSCEFRRVSSGAVFSLRRRRALQYCARPGGETPRIRTLSSLFSRHRDGAIRGHPAAFRRCA